MKLHFHPVSTVSRPVVLLAADEGIALDYETVDLFSGAHQQPAFECRSRAYPQDLQQRARAVLAANLAFSRARAHKWLEVLDEKLLGGNRYVCGSDITLADYLGVAVATLGKVVRLDFSRWRDVQRWIDTMKAGPNWAKVNEPFYAHFVGAFSAGTYAGL